MLITYTTNSFPNDYTPTVFDNYTARVSLDDETYRLPLNIPKSPNSEDSLTLWDTAGQDTYDRLRPLTYPMTDVFIVCFSVVDPTSFANVIQKWIPEIRQHCPDIPLILVGTKIDQRNDRERLEMLKQKNQEPISYEQGFLLGQSVDAEVYVECRYINK